MKKNIVLIGGSHGIGLEIAKQLHQRYELFILSRSRDGLDGLHLKHLPFDVQKDEPNLAALPETIDGLVYCPGTITLKAFRMIDSFTFREDMEVNYFGLVKVVQALQSRMTEGSNMVFFSTVAAQTGMPFHTSISGAKGAVEGFARALAAEYAPRVRVNVIAPSLVNTPLASRLLNNENKIARMAERHPLKRVGDPRDIADLAVFLLSSENHWITGQVFGVDGGLSTLNLN